MNNRFVFATTGGSSGGGSENNDDPEKKKEEKKKKEEEEKKEKEEKNKKAKDKKEKEEQEEAKEKAKDLEVDERQKIVGSQAHKTIDMAEKMKKMIDSGDPDNIAFSTEIDSFQTKMSGLEAEEKSINKPLESKLSELVARKKISRDDEKRLLELDPLDPDFEVNWTTLTAAMPELLKDKDELKKLRDIFKVQEKKLEELKKKTEEAMDMFREMSEKRTPKIAEKRDNERYFNTLEASTGVSFKVGQELIYYDKKQKRYATITKIEFEEIEVPGKEGEEPKKIQTGIPVITIRSQDEDSKVLGESKFSFPNFVHWLEGNGVTENITTLVDLERTVGHKIKKGDKIEYHQVIDSMKRVYRAEDITVEVKEVDETEETIKLNEPVMLDGKKKSKLSYGEFARWYKLNEAMPPIEELKDLRQKLLNFRDFQNSQRPKDQPNPFVHIEVKPGEVLMYNNKSKYKFKIKKVDEANKKIELDDGEKKSYTDFLRWVKRSYVQKLNPELAEHEDAISTAEEVAEEREKDEEKKLKPKAPTIEQKEGGITEVHPGEGEKVPPLPKGEKDTSPEVPRDKFIIPHTEEFTEPHVGYFSNLWDNTYLLSLGDFMEMGKTLWEFVKRKWGRRQHEKVGKVGEAVFGPVHGGEGWGLHRILGKQLSTELGAEYKGVWKHAEQEETGHHEKHLEHQGYEDIVHELHDAPNKDVFKAAMSVLAKKGQLRWDDHAMWNQANKLFKGVPRWVNTGNPAGVLDDLKEILDHHWGQNTFRDIFQSQESGYKSTKGNFMESAKRLENAPDEGLKGALKRLLRDHMNGKYVNPAEYEAYIEYAIVEGKMGFEDKMFFIIMGLGVEGGDHHHPHTLLSLDRMAILGNQMNKVPLLEFFMDPNMILRTPDGTIKQEVKDGVPQFDEKTGLPKPAKGRPDIDMFKYWAHQYIEKGILKEGKPGGFNDIKKDWKDCGWKSAGKTFEEFVVREMAYNDWVRTRAEKSARDSSSWDHDDMDRFIQLMSEEQIENVTNYAGGARQQVSTPGVKNAFVGLNNFSYLKLRMMRESVNQKDEENAQKNMRHLLDLLRSFIRMDAIVDRRYKTGVPQTRFSYRDYDSFAGVDEERYVKFHIREMREFIGELAKHFKLEERWNLVINKFEGLEDKLKKQSEAVQEFGKLLETHIKAYEKEHGIKAVLELFEQVNEKNKDKTEYQPGVGLIGLNIKGAGAKPDKRAKKESEGQEAVPTGLQEYLPPEIDTSLKIIKDLEKDLEVALPIDQKTISEGDNKRYLEIREQAEKFTYSPHSRDKKILDDRITEIQKQIAEKKGIAPPKEEKKEEGKPKK